jgi:hypothetical protein
MRSVVILGLFVGVLMIVVGYVNQLQKCPPPHIEYRYIPRTFKEDQNNPVQVSEIYSKMFTEPSPWIAGMKIAGNASKTSTLNRYYISQDE